MDLTYQDTKKGTMVQWYDGTTAQWYDGKKVQGYEGKVGRMGEWEKNSMLNINMLTGLRSGFHRIW